VDHDIKLIIYTDRLEFFLQSGKDLGQGNYQFTSRRPRNAQVSVRRIKGRNDIEITEQPSRYNDYKAVIRITDRRGGSDQTEVVVSW